MPELANLLSFILAACFVIIVPGPATLLVAELASLSVQGAAIAVAGIVMGDIVLIALSAAGFAVLMQSLPWLLPGLRMLGAAYLLYLGINLLRSAGTMTQLQPRPASVSFARGLLITISNPKPILFFSTFFPLYLSPAHDAAVQGFVTLGAMFEVINVLYFILLCSILRWTAKRLAHSKGRQGWLQKAGVHKICCVGLILCSLAMAWNF
ncbi:LysE family transporter [Undibacterium pigrum]|uniref:Threonine/homoserine/homoserine lactone efflux protein n=1 Tax=Undibacterium pigrum TaxID=401470 RepID=A0A318J4V9_9BURK|nr:LysE family transporter [Undibacterium pigrum]PXX42694.1 threonine/homoserine/homoserine lactone efflux protein [Undibacterium pigrum]